MCDNDRGLYNKFNVTRTDGSSAPGGKHEHCSYFVLDLDHDEFAVKALRAYAIACSSKYPALAEDLWRATLKMTVQRDCTHEMFTAKDFTQEEIGRRNELAVMVLEEGALVCKKCGKARKPNGAKI